VSKPWFLLVLCFCQVWLQCLNRIFDLWSSLYLLCFCTLVTILEQRIMIWRQPGQIVHETLSWKSLSQKRVGGVA
jgi:hypothetical protein